MPIYEYLCKACGHEFEKEQRITDKPARKCPSCGAMRAKRLISRTSFVLKGSGWYNDLYASGKKPEKEATKKESSTSEAASSDTKSTASQSGTGAKEKGKAKKGSTTPAGSGSSRAA